ncbi:MerR family transcriptional regulator [Spirosoma sp. KNUC1025]|uniref:MerR family transcriptional regulator n=1 Tax=Spirosoma sp. KNUC1025 TaxID=2894082 RepID=UPI00386C8E36|nr:MerR family transcriptional regulator [Spirosoma sp. KNUC1025]
MYIRELADRTGLTPDTIRFYEKLNLLQSHRPTRRGHRQYNDSHVAALLQIKYIKAMGFTLKDIQEKFTDWRAGRLTNTEKRAILEAQLQKINEAAAEIEQVRHYLQKKIGMFPD